MTTQSDAQNPFWWLGEELNEVLESPGHNVVLFGSAVMLLHGLREDVGDVDLFITREAWATIAVKHAGRWRVRFPAIGDPPLLEWTGGPRVVHAFERWTSRDWWINVQEAWDRREVVNGWPCVPLAIVGRWKVQAAKYNPGSERHKKHLADARVIREHLDKLKQEAA